MIIETADLAEAWARAFLATLGSDGIRPLVVSLQGFEEWPTEDEATRKACDTALVDAGQWSIATTASTIFPSSLWNRSEGRHHLYERYRKVLPKLKRIPANRRGTYFSRLTAYGAGDLNQLEQVIETWEKGVTRRSAFVASIFDPVLDHTGTQLLGFPCLHQVGFSPENSGGFAVSGWYTTQHIFTRGYGNYLGLVRLGGYMANAFGRSLTRVTCVATTAAHGCKRKRDVAGLARQLRDRWAVGEVKDG